MLILYILLAIITPLQPSTPQTLKPTYRDPIPGPTIPARFVPGMWFRVFDFANPNRVFDLANPNR
eukprot:3606709-Rhodomonas_salina.1